MGNRAVFIDRDGTINVNFEYLDDPDNLMMYPTVAEGIKRLKDEGFNIIVITNQSGIARGYFSVETLAKIHQKMKNDLLKKGADVDAIYYCPHHPDENCDCRKPKTGLLKKAIKDFNIDVEKSYFIGDRMLDIEAGYNINCKTILIPEDKEKVDQERKESNIEPDYICDNFISGVIWISKNSKENI